MSRSTLSVAQAKTLVEEALAQEGKIDGARLGELVAEGLTMKFYAGAYVVRLAGVGGTSTMSWRAALESWLRAANKRQKKQKLSKLGVLSIALGLLLGTPSIDRAQAQPLPVCSGPDRAARGVTCVVDGDTFWLAGERFRLSCIDTPELGEPGFTQARGLLAVLLARPGTLIMAEGRRDRFGRQVATLVTGQGNETRSVSGEIVEAGLARWTDYPASRAFCARWGGRP